MTDELFNQVSHLTREGHAPELKILARAILSMSEDVAKLREEVKEAKAAAAGPPPEKPAWKRPGAPTADAESEAPEGEEAEEEAPAGPPPPPNLGAFGS